MFVHNHAFNPTQGNAVAGKAGQDVRRRGLRQTLFIKMSGKPIVNSYGLFWREDLIFWGRQKVNGTLLGAASQTARAKPVDFRDQRGIYALYAEYELVYIGQTGAKSDRLFNRLKTHLSDHLSERWDRFSWFGLKWVTQQHVLAADTQAVSSSISIALNVLEATSIAIAEPRLNLQRGKWGDATQYFQYRDSRLDE